MKKKRKILKPVYKHDEEYYYQVLANNMRKLRKAQHLTQQDVADLAGTDRQYICDIENRNRNKRPTIAIAGRIADAFDISLSELFKEDETEKHQNEEDSNK